MKFAKLAIATGLASMLAACGSTGVFNRDRPDEFAVQRQAPLVIPPDFNLVPPSEGNPRPAEGSAAEQALEALFGGPAARSDVETSALDRAGAAVPGIRSKIGDPDTNTVDKGALTRDIVSAPESEGQVARAVIPG
ncbi:DUF3035 domain-containing protein [Blastomonas marina]|jgi:hypothetical protein|uniref:DUF3035 domain-containing protein n=1 Tax=Blastomonas marina TaxID=1867408 RepID=A0ABQ1FHD4_9SPHN|nr:DUF3035 domain-containing protein [Blastomonas marina]WPZ03391.1 DUF3035 domain-containing protein [Blastomonas marina]GGA11654.1 hypothetical protein GCM10010923_22840 [Blastomonas marina]